MIPGQEKRPNLGPAIAPHKVRARDRCVLAEPGAQRDTPPAGTLSSAYE
jgi:hypothetical protein